MTSRWRVAGRGAWAIADQALFAASNFVLNLLIARWMGPEEYGVFGVAFAVFLLVSLAQTALIIDPLLVFGVGRWRDSFRRYLGQVLRSQLALAAVGSLAVAAASLVVSLVQGGGPLAAALLTLAWVAPCVAVQWMLRRACYVHGHPSTAAAGGALYMVLLIALAFLARATIGLSATTALALLAIASVLVSAFLAWRLAALLPTDVASDEVPDGTSMLVAHWGFGRWILASYLLGWMATDVFYVVLAPQHGYAAVGAVRATFNLVQPILHVITAVGTTALVSFVGLVRSQHPRLPILPWWAGMTALGAAYSLALLPSASFLMELVYGATFEVDLTVAWFLGLLPIPAATQVAFSTILRALERSRELFLANLVTAAVAAAIGVPLAWSFGAAGAAGAMLLTGTTAALATGWQLWRVRR